MLLRSWQLPRKSPWDDSPISIALGLCYSPFPRFFERFLSKMWHLSLWYNCRHLRRNLSRTFPASSVTCTSCDLVTMAKACYFPGEGYELLRNWSKTAHCYWCFIRTEENKGIFNKNNSYGLWSSYILDLVLEIRGYNVLYDLLAKSIKRIRQYWYNYTVPNTLITTLNTQYRKLLV